MNSEDTVEYNSLRWVKKELDLILQEAQASLSAYIEDTSEAGRLRESVEHLHMVQGTLQMVELYGAAQLAEEMEKVSEALLNGKIDKVDDAYDVLMRSMLQLPDYLESLQSGSKDVPMVLLPLLNDLRASRSASLLSENVLFFPDVDSDAEEVADIDVESGQLLATAKKLRPHYQIGLLGWFKGQKVNASLKRLLAVLNELEKKSAQSSIRRIWSISAALVEGLAQEGIDTNISIKMLMGQVDRSIKQLIDSGEEVFAKNTPADLLKNLLYYVARVETESARVDDIKTIYRLKELLPADSELEEARSGMGGLNTELLSTVSSGIREDLLEVKDSLEIFVHSDVQDMERLGGLPDLLTKIADTLSMLGLGMPREQVLGQKEQVEKIISGEDKATDEVIMTMAGVLLSVESQLNSFIANRASMGDGDTVQVGGLDAMPNTEYHEVLTAVIREALQDFNHARQAILSYLEDPSDRSVLQSVITRLDEVDGAMFMLPIERLKHQFDSVRSYVLKVMLNAGQVPGEATQNDLADVVTSIEYFLEAIQEGRPDLELSMNSGNEAAARLDAITAEKGVDSSPELAVEEVAPPVVEEAVAPATVEVEVADTDDDGIEEQRYVILGDDADEEILEIFIEEALEELASLSEQLPLWQNDNGNEEALITIRRSFHTLKGSGRLIGAELIGEFAWVFETMLNRVIDKSRPLTSEVFEVLHEALGVLPQLIEQLKGNREPIPNVYRLYDKVDLLGKWKKPAAGDQAVSKKSAPGTDVEEPVIQATQMSDEADIIEELDVSLGLGLEAELEAGLEFETELTPEASAEDVTAEIDPAQTIEISEDEIMAEISEDELTLGLEPESIGVISDFDDADESDDDFDIDLTEELEALQVATSDEDETLESGGLESSIEEIEFDENLLSDNNEPAEIELSELVNSTVSELEESQIYIDPVLFDIFKGESDSHVNQIRLMLDQHYQGIAPLTANPELLRALHTLYGSARTAEVEEIAELCGGLEKYVRHYLSRNDLSIVDAGVKLVDDVSAKVAVMLQELADRNQQLNSDSALLQRIEDLLHEIQRENEVAEKAATTTQEALSEAMGSDGPEIVETLVSYSDVDDELVDIFLEEAEELLDSCENSLQRWNTNNVDEDSVMDLQRHLHTLKGGARMADLSPVGDLTHALESLVINVNDGRLPFTKDMSKILHESLDRLSDMLAKVKDRAPLSSADALISHIDAIRKGKEISTSPAPGAIKEEDDDPEPAYIPEPDAQLLPETDEEILHEIEDVDSDDIQIELTEESVLLENFEFEISEDNTEEVSPDISLLVPEEDEIVLDLDSNYDVELSTESVLDEEVRLEESVDVSIVNGVEPVFVAEPEVKAGDASKHKLEKTEPSPDDVVAQPKDSMATEQVRVRSDLLNDLVNHAGEISVYHARMGQQITNFSFNLSEMEQTVIRLREQLRKLSIETEAQILSRYEKETDQYDKDFDPLEMDRFSTMQQISRSLQETVGDIESIKDILSEDVRDSETLLLQESRVSTELQEGLMRTRMVHFGGLASRLRRIMRQTARELDKDVELDITGETSEVDRTVLDRIVAPLEHMLRNAVSHGIEMPADRVSAGKSETGRVKISVDREGGDVVITVVDDGRGIDANAIRKKAVEKGMMDANNKLSDHDVLQYIMEPGFSTAEKVTQISGRGVGMDVVDSEIKQLGGVLEIDTVKGKGTTFKIRLPLTLAINHALLVNVGDEVYAVPLNSIEGVVRLSGPELQQFYDSGERTYEFAGSSYELKHLGYTLTGIQPDYSRSGQLFPVLLARAGEQSVALHVDDLIGRREIVVKPVGAQISTVRGISGATILGDGRVVLILEMNALVIGDSLFHITDTEQGEVEQIAPVVEEQAETLVMVVDDSITIRKVTERMLTRNNMKVITAKDGIDAVSQLQDIKPDVMLLDIEMPRMDGYEVATHVRNDARLKDLPIIMITSRSGAKHRDKAMEIGVNKYLGKPYQEDDLMENIRDVLS